MKTIEEIAVDDSNHLKNELRRRTSPLVIRGAVSEWQSVQSYFQSEQEFCQYLKEQDSGQAVYTVLAAPEQKGRFFYSPDYSSVNFQRTQGKLTEIIEFLQRNQGQETAAVAVQAAKIEHVLPDFEQANCMKFCPEEAPATLWMGNQAVVAPHYDVQSNIACVIAGQRRFTLFPPEQVNNLYIGPMLNAPGGVPISCVDFREPDLARFPRFKQALETASQATLEAGDVIFIPALWWHGVESLAPINALVNYWWGGLGARQLSPNIALSTALLTIKNLPSSQRAAWQAYFNYMVFDQEPAQIEHLPANLNDLLSDASPEQITAVINSIREQLDSD